jgi:dTDP-4-amino-4,6-dideoxygalactose transaminase
MISIYELTLKSIVADGKDASRRLPDDWLLFDAGRSALFFLLAYLKETAGIRSVAVNAYTTDVMHRTIAGAGLEVVPLDVESRTFRPLVPETLDLRTCVVIQTGLFGFNSYDDALPGRVRAAGGVFLEDCCNSFGTMIHGKESGSYGDAAFFSFRVGKPLSSSGGALRINRNDLVAPLRKRYAQVAVREGREEKIKILRTYLDYVVFAPFVLKYVSRPLRKLQQRVPLLGGLVKGGVVDTLSEVDAASLRKMTPAETAFATRRLSRWADEYQVKREVSDNLCSLLRGYPLYMYADNPEAAGGWNCLFFPVLLENGDPDEFVEHMRASGFDASRFHGKVPALSFPQLGRKELPGTYTLVDRLVCIPNTTRMRGKEKQLALAVDRYFAGLKKK